MKHLASEDGISGPAVAAIAAAIVIVLIAIFVALRAGGDDESATTIPREDDVGALDTLPPGGTLATLPPGGTLETLPSATTTSPDTIPRTTTTTAATTATPPPPVTPQDVRDVLGPLLGDDDVDDAFQSLLEWPNVTTFDRQPPLEGPGLTFVRSGLFEIPGDQETFDRWDDADIPHALSDEFILFVGILDEAPQADDGITRQLGLIISDGDDVLPDLGAGHVGSSSVYFFQQALDPDDFGTGWLPATSFDVENGFTPTDTGAFGFFEFGNTTTAVLVPKDEVGDSILSGLIFGRLTEGEPENNRQPATTRTVTLLADPFGDGAAPLPPIDPGRFEVSGTINGQAADVEPGDEDITELTFEELLVKLRLRNGCGINNHYWVFASAATDVEYTLTVTDTATDTSRSYGSNPFEGQPSPAVVDTSAFATCP